MMALILAATLGTASPVDEAYHAALEVFYDGSTQAGLERLAALSAAHPDDPVGPYLEALALCWLIEQRGGRAPELEREFQRRVERVLEVGAQRLRRDPKDARARMARGAAHGVRSRLHCFRYERRAGAREAARAREELLAARTLDPTSKDLLFGLGLYDYYVDVLPRLLKIVRFFLSMPGGDRERGLAWVEEASRESSLHRTEALAQLYDIYAFYEEKPDRGLEAVRDLRARYPGSPLWALRLAEHLRDRMGLYAESAQVAREIIQAAEEGRANYAPVVGAMARVCLGEALLLDLRLAEARAALEGVEDAVPEAPWVGPRAHLLIGRSLEIEADRRAAERHYRLAATGGHRETRKRAKEALSSPMSAAEAEGLRLLGEARRLAEEGRQAEAAEVSRKVLAVWPSCQEAALRAAEEDLRQGRLSKARSALERLAEEDKPQPPWVRPWTRLLLGHLHDLAGDRAAALRQYNLVWKEPCGRQDLRARAAEGLRRAYTGGGADRRPGAEFINPK